MCAAVEVAKSEMLHRSTASSTLGAAGARPAPAAVVDAALSFTSRLSAILSEPVADEEDALRIRPSAKSTLEGADAAPASNAEAVTPLSLASRLSTP